MKSLKDLRIKVIFFVLCFTHFFNAQLFSSENPSGNPSGNPKQIALKIQIFDLLPSVNLVFPGGGDLVGEKGQKLKNLRPNERFEWAVGNNPAAKQKKRSSKKSLDLTKREIRFQPRAGRIVINGNPYRGSLSINFRQNGAKVVNYVSLEDYVMGVVGSEISSLSPAETLKAQAVIARTYAFANRGKHGKNVFDLCNKDHCQIYGGINAERPVVAQAIRDTNGIIMIHKGNPISTLYHATCGGMTSDNDKVWGGPPAEYLRRVKCNFCQRGINYRWNRDISFASLKKQLNSEGIRVENIDDVKINSESPFDRVTEMAFVSNKTLFKIKGTTFRRLFNLPSTTFVIKNSDSIQISAKKEKSDPIQGNGKSEMEPDVFVIQYSKGIRRVLKPREGWHVISSSKIQPIVFGKPLLKTRNTRETILDTSISQKLSLKGVKAKSEKLLLLGDMGIR
ncbi:SpoIID/LytB domain-containing protein [bacterium]|nr:SpoIID/LytB domain-containing protein [bacterium]